MVCIQVFTIKFFQFFCIVENVLKHGRKTLRMGEEKSLESLDAINQEKNIFISAQYCPGNVGFCWPICLSVWEGIIL